MAPLIRVEAEMFTHIHTADGRGRVGCAAPVSVPAQMSPPSSCLKGSSDDLKRGKPSLPERTRPVMQQELFSFRPIHASFVLGPFLFDTIL